MRILVIRTSAMGDVALTLPVLKSVTRLNPGTEIILLTRKPFSAFFSLETGINLFIAEFKGKHKGLTGLLRLFRELNSGRNFDYVIDIHDVLRTKVLRWMFRLKGISVKVINKDRKARRELLNGKRKTWLKHTVERYADTFRKAGLKVDPATERAVLSFQANHATLNQPDAGRELLIGIAPSARHKLKKWPADNMLKLMSLISEKCNASFILFGGKEEKEELDYFSSRLRNCNNLAGKLSLDEELALIAKLSFMIAMDSANMHMAALAGTRVISIWGATDPMNGFGAWMQDEEFSVRIPVEELSCRPCTIFGKGECRRGDFACMNMLTPERVLEVIRRKGLLNI